MPGLEQLQTNPVLLYGPNGMLGRAWAALLQDQNIEHKRIDRDRTDLNDLDRCAEPIDRPCVVIVCAAYTDVDGAESDTAVAMRVNAEAIGRIAERCAASDATLVTYSSDYVFDGSSTTAYRPEATIAPINVYGRTKAAGEAAVALSGCHHLTIRTSWLYAPWGRNFVRTIASLAKQRSALDVVNDQTGRPTSAESLATNSLRLLESGATGLWHLTDGGACTWFELAQEVVRLTGADCQMKPCSTSEMPRPAARPTYSVLDMERTEKELGSLVAWQQSLADVVQRLE
jgi:dTDP-4-dehydrorhamnose reductase